MQGSAIDPGTTLTRPFGPPSPGTGEGNTDRYFIAAFFGGLAGQDLISSS